VAVKIQFKFFWLVMPTLGMDEQGSIPGGGWEFFFSTPCPDRLWGPPSVISNVYQGSFPGGKAAEV